MCLESSRVLIEGHSIDLYSSMAGDTQLHALPSSLQEALGIEPPQEGVLTEAAKETALLFNIAQAKKRQQQKDSNIAINLQLTSKKINISYDKLTRSTYTIENIIKT